MTQPERQSPRQQPLGFDYEEGHTEQGLAALAGIPVFLQAFRSLDLPRSVEKHVSVKQRQRGLDEASYAENFLILNAAGGECLDDFAHLPQRITIPATPPPISGRATSRIFSKTMVPG